ncbi:DUF4815 domain-containing protein [Pseudoalteromonas sp. T1lg23B]|uniref:DUF4815 domain-containing protein n=1 Tax=Pseudoalteromonas sp. T1lg23B TaxID=2077097 RepID=UPI000CF6D870|nr:DUF4815 domain-containing protein [Pseudoalteromonas sp. T1lg23B]
MQEHIYNQIVSEHPDFYQKFDAAKQYEQILFRAGKGLQSRELNDVQCQVSHQLKGVADALLKDGDIVAGGGVRIEAQQARVAAASVYIRGAVRQLAERSFDFDTSGDAIIGVLLDSEVITEQEDGELRDPAGVNSPMLAQNYNEAGAARLKVTAHWGLLTQAQNTNTEFYPVYQINQGVLVIKEAPPEQDSITRALARYDRESNGGNYVVEGLGLHYIKTAEDQQHFSLQAGKAHIAGYELSYATALPVSFEFDPDVQSIKTEKAELSDVQDASSPIKFDYPPVKQVERVYAVVRKVAMLTRSDQLQDSFPNTSVDTVEQISYQDKIYVEHDDYEFEGNHIVWKLAGERPPVGSSYQVTYTYGTSVPVTFNATHYSIDKSFIDSGNEVLPDQIRVDYQRHSPRIDLIVLNAQGQVKRIKGASVLEHPEPPHVPEQHLPLAYVYQYWGESVPRVESVAIHSLSMLDLQNMQRQIGDLYQLLAIERLRNDANSQDPASKYGVFVDPFLDDDLRDQGREQSAAIIDGELTLPVDAIVSALNASSTELLPYELEDVLTQPKRTGQMKVNPYQAFEPVPAEVTLSPNVDHWTVTTQRWSSPITRRFNRGGGRIRRISTRVETQRVGVQTQQVEFLRPRTVRFSISGFGPGEELETVLFDGITLTAEEI